MTPENALELLNQIRLKSPMIFADHQLALQAYETLKQFVEANTPKRSS